MSGDEFKAPDTTYFAEGLRVTSLVIENGKIAAVWHPGSGTQWIHWGMSGDDVAAKDRTSCRITNIFGTPLVLFRVGTSGTLRGAISALVTISQRLNYVTERRSDDSRSGCQRHGQLVHLDGFKVVRRHEEDGETNWAKLSFGNRATEHGPPSRGRLVHNYR
jgi:hypothetical protein